MTPNPLDDIRLPDSDGATVRLGDLWKDDLVVLVWLRHYGWTFCREHVAQLRAHAGEIEASGARVVTIGMGTPAMAAAFKEEANLPFTLLVDHTKETYRRLEVKKGSLLDIAGPSVWLKGIKSILKSGQKKPEQDPFQLGATAIIEPGGEVRHLHRSSDSSDNFPMEKLLAIL